MPLGFRLPPSQEEVDKVLQKHGRKAKVLPGGRVDFSSPSQTPDFSRFSKMGDAFAQGIVGAIPGPGDIRESLATIPSMGATQNPLLGALVALPMAQQLQKAGEARTTSERLGHGLAGLLPLVGPAAAQAGESIGSGDPLKMSEGLGQTFSMLAPTAPGAGKGAAGALRKMESNYAQSLLGPQMHPQQGALRMGAMQELRTPPVAPPQRSPVVTRIGAGLRERMRSKDFITRQGGEAGAKALQDPKVLQQMEDNLSAGKPLWEGEPVGAPSLDQYPLRRGFHEQYLSPRGADPAQVFQDVPGLGKKLNGLYQQHGFQSPPQRLSSGLYSAVYDLGDATTGPLKGRPIAIRVSAEKATPFPKTDWMVPVHETHVTPEGVRVDVVDRLRPPTRQEIESGITVLDFEDLKKRVRADGYNPGDLHAGNIMYTSDGRLVVSDLGGVQPTGMASAGPTRAFFDTVARAAVPAAIPAAGAALGSSPPRR